MSSKPIWLFHRTHDKGIFDTEAILRFNEESTLVISGTIQDNGTFSLANDVISETTWLTRTNQYLELVPPRHIDVYAGMTMTPEEVASKVSGNNDLKIAVRKALASARLSSKQLKTFSENVALVKDTLDVEVVTDVPQQNNTETNDE